MKQWTGTTKALLEASSEEASKLPTPSPTYAQGSGVIIRPAITDEWDGPCTDDLQTSGFSLFRVSAPDKGGKVVTE